MSLRSQTVPSVPEETARIARAAFPKGYLYMQIRDDIGILLTDANFADLFPSRGQPAYAPWRLAGFGSLIWLISASLCPNTKHNAYKYLLENNVSFALHRLFKLESG